MSNEANGGCRQNKLRRLPFIFEKVLELPFHDDADVWVEETRESIIFTVNSAYDIAGDIKAETVETFPGVSKIVIRGEVIAEPAGSERTRFVEDSAAGENYAGARVLCLGNGELLGLCKSLEVFN